MHIWLYKYTSKSDTWIIHLLWGSTDASHLSLCNSSMLFVFIIHIFYIVNVFCPQKSASSIPYIDYPKDVIGASSIKRRQHMPRKRPADATWSVLPSSGRRIEGWHYDVPSVLYDYKWQARHKCLWFLLRFSYIFGRLPLLNWVSATYTCNNLDNQWREISEG